jgi:hypothetical protein
MSSVTTWLREQLLYQRYEEWRHKNPLNLKSVDLREFSREEHASFRNYSSECYREGVEIYDHIIDLLKAGVWNQNKLPMKELENLLQSLRSVSQQHKDNWVLFYRV